MRTRLAALAGVALLAAGCGGAKDATDAAQLVPADAQAYVQLRAHVPPPSAFPFAPAEYTTLRLPKLAPPVAIALLPEGWVAFRRAKSKTGHRIRGFTVVAQTKAALDAVRHVRSPLAAVPRYRIGDAPLSAYFRGGRTLDVTDTTATVRRPAPAVPTIGSVSVPSDTVAAVGLASGAPPPSTLPVLRTISKALGVDVQMLLRAIDGPAYAYLEPSDLVPRVTVVGTPRHPARARQDVRQLLLRIGRETTPGTVDLGPLAVTYRLENGRLVVSTDTEGAATSALADLPGGVIRFAYVHGATSTIETLAPALGLRKPRAHADFLLYEAREGAFRTRVVRLLP